MVIQRGTRLVVRTALEDRLEVRALGPVELGRAFRVVWVCREAEWLRSRSEGTAPVSAPIPEADVLEQLEAPADQHDAPKPGVPAAAPSSR